MHYLSWWIICSASSWAREPDSDFSRGRSIRRGTGYSSVCVWLCVEFETTKSQTCSCRCNLSSICVSLLFLTLTERRGRGDVASSRSLSRLRHVSLIFRQHLYVWRISLFPSFMRILYKTPKTLITTQNTQRNLLFRSFDLLLIEVLLQLVRKYII